MLNVLFFLFGISIIMFVGGCTLFIFGLGFKKDSFTGLSGLIGLFGMMGTFVFSTLITALTY